MASLKRARGTPEPASHRAHPSYKRAGKRDPRGIQIKQKKGGLDIKKGDTQREMAVDVADP